MTSTSAIILLVMLASACSSKELERKAKAYDEFCWMTRQGINEDRRAFESGTAEQKEEAYRRFYSGQTIHHNARSLTMCIGEGRVPPLDDACWLKKDWSCLARLAAEIETLLPNVSMAE